jgi:DNA invertase Pin-like site-specific DNA recombinase
LKALGYLRVSTQEQGDSGAGIEAQRNAIQSWAESGQVSSVEWIEDSGYSAKSLKRPGIQAALSQIDEGDFLVVSKLDRLSRSVIDFAGLLKISQVQGWNLVALDLGVDTSTPTGKMIAQVMMSVAEWEREMIGLRTSEAMAVLKANGDPVGRPRQIPAPIRAEIWRMRVDECRTFAFIASHLNDLAVPTAHNGSKWHPSTVKAVIESMAQDLASED